MCIPRQSPKGVQSAVVRDASYGVRRFSDFVAHLRLPRAVLTDRLNSLTAAGVLERAPTGGR
jgi:DNA-binding HxlR family transcriptional regulator